MPVTQIWDSPDPISLYKNIKLLNAPHLSSFCYKSHPNPVLESHSRVIPNIVPPVLYELMNLKFQTRGFEVH